MERGRYFVACRFEISSWCLDESKEEEGCKMSWCMGINGSISAVWQSTRGVGEYLKAIMVEWQLLTLGGWRVVLITMIFFCWSDTSSQFKRLDEWLICGWWSVDVVLIEGCRVEWRRDWCLIECRNYDGGVFAVGEYWRDWGECWQIDLKWHTGIQLVRL